MSAIVVCLDCPNYRNGGWCTLKHKDTGALAPACTEAINNQLKKNDMKTLSPQAKTKVCTKCGQELPISEFYARAGSKDGLQTICKACHNAKIKESIERRKAKLAEKLEQTEAPAQTPVPVVVREILTDKQMVDLLREHGWTVKCYRTITEEL